MISDHVASGATQGGSILAVVGGAMATSTDGTGQSGLASAGLVMAIAGLVTAIAGLVVPLAKTLAEQWNLKGRLDESNLRADKFEALLEQALQKSDRNSQQIEELKPRQRVLIVDDDPSTCELYCRHVSKAGYDCQVAQSLDDAALAIGGPVTFNHVMLDLTLGDRSGLELLEEIKARSLISKVIVITGRTGEALDQANRLKADMILVKPSIDWPAVISWMHARDNLAPRSPSTDLDAATIQAPESRP
jgi:ActR/RegA family two-component response regulator